MSCKPNPEVVEIIKAMAKNRLAAGMTDPHAIVNAIHAEINPHTTLWKSEVAEAILSATGKPRVLSPAAKRLKALKDELRDLRDTQDELTGKRYNVRRQKQLTRDIEKLQAQIDSGDFAKAATQPAPKDALTVELEAKMDHLRAERERAIARIELSGRSPIRRATDFAFSFMRAMILSSPTVFPHLIGASAWRLVSTVLGDAADAAMRIIPAYRRLSDKALVAGGGFHASAHLAGARRAVSKETLQSMWEKIRYGQSRRAALYKSEHPSASPYVLEIVGKLHDVVKTPIEQYAYGRALARQTRNITRKMERNGASKDAIENALLTDSAQAVINARAYAESQAAKLQGDSRIVDAWNRGLRQLENTGDLGAVATSLIRAETPIVRIPLNYTSEAASYIGGGFKAASDLKHLRREAKKQGIPFDLTPEQADKIVGNLRNQAVGAGLLALGFMAYEHFGGLYRPNKKPPNPDVPVGDIKIGEHEVSHHLTHSPMIGVLQAGALMRYAMEEDRRKAPERPELARAIAASVVPLTALIMDVPQLDIPQDMLKLLYGGDTAGKLIGSKVAQYTIPGAVQWYARHEDVDEEGNPIKRRPKNFTDAIKQAVPGYRQEVPTR